MHDSKDTIQGALDQLRSADPVMRDIIDRVGPYGITYREPDFSTLVRSVVYQQLSGKAAATIYARLEAACGRKVTPRSILRLELAQLRELGLSQQKASYVRDLAERTAARKLVFRLLAECPDEEVIRRLTEVKGVGVWTAHMFLIFALRRPDVLPTGDLGIRTAIRKAYSLDKLPAPDQMQAIAAPWRPYCSVACWYLWRSLENQGAM